MRLRFKEDRRKIKEWSKKILEFSESNKSDDPFENIRSLYALDMAHIESGIYGLVAVFGLEQCKSIVKQTLRDILNAYGNPEHWRNREDF